MRSWKRWLARLRLLLYALILGLVGLFVWRFDSVRLPKEGCSPLWAFAPGDWLVVDVRPSSITVGDAILFRGPRGELLLARVVEPPRSAPPPIWEAYARGELWVEGEREDCPGADSRTLGVLGLEQVVGRIALVMPW